MPPDSPYLFRHALLRDAAYQLQLPGDRARLHGEAFALIEALCGGRPPAPVPLTAPGGTAYEPRAGDAHAEELAGHARLGPDAGRALEGPYLRRAAEHAEWTCRNEAAIAHWEALAAVSAGPERGESLRRACEAARRAGRARQAEPLARRALEALRPHGGRQEIAALGSLATVLMDLGRPGEAEPVVEEALPCCRRDGDRRSEGIALGFRAILRHGRGQADLAEADYEQALLRHRESGLRGEEAAVLVNLAMLACDTARFPRAEQLLRDVLARGLDRRRLHGIALGTLALVYQRTARAPLAREAYAEALALHRGIGDRRYEGSVLGNLAALLWETGLGAEAEAAYRQAIAIHRETGNRRFEGIALGNLALLLLSDGRAAEGESALRQALELNREVGDRASEGIALGNLASARRDAGRLEEADRLYRDALALHREVGDRRNEAAHRCEFAILEVMRGRPDDARREWSEGAAVLRELGDSDNLARLTEGMRRACGKAGVTGVDGLIG